jgi:Domain of unknown function (DUF4190)
MKYCPQCHKQFTEVWITFCSDDGTILIDSGFSPGQQPPFQNTQRPAPPTTEQPTWRSPDPNAPGAWVAPDERPPMRSPAWQPPPPPSVYPRQQQSHGLAVASMILGIASLFVGMFCLGPLPGIAALILGLVALSQIKKAPDRNSGKPLAIVGVVTGSLSVLIFGAWLLFIVVVNL